MFTDRTTKAESKSCQILLLLDAVFANSDLLEVSCSGLKKHEAVAISEAISLEQILQRRIQGLKLHYGTLDEMVLILSIAFYFGLLR